MSEEKEVKKLTPEERASQGTVPDLCTLKDGQDFYEYAERWMGWHL